MLDEYHKAKTYNPDLNNKPGDSQTGQAMAELQCQLKDAQVMYYFAIGVIETCNMAYISRLDLWRVRVGFLHLGNSKIIWENGATVHLK